MRDLSTAGRRVNAWMQEQGARFFVTRKGQKLKIECSREAYDKIPFNQQGSLTYKRNTLVKFKYYEDTVYNN